MSDQSDELDALEDAIYDILAPEDLISTVPPRKRKKRSRERKKLLKRRFMIPVKDLHI